MNQRHKVAVIGLGSMGRNHARVLSSLEGAELAAVCDSETRRLISGPWHQLVDYRTLKFGELAYCVIATPTNSHLEIGQHILEHGVPILVEKPAASTSAEIDQFLSAAQRSSGRVVVGMIERFNRTVIEAQSLVRSGRMGRLLKIATRRIGPPPGRDMGVGVLTDLGIHDLDLVGWISGEDLANMQLRALSNIVSLYDDHVLVSARLTSGAIVSIEVSWISPIKRREIELIFSSGVVTLDLLSGEVAISELSEETIEWEAVQEFFGAGRVKKMVYGVKTVEPLVAEHQAVIKAIQTGNWANLPSLAESKNLLELIESAERF